MSLIQPCAPHIAEELWAALGHERLWEAPWPVADPALLEVDTVEVVVQVNGKIRDRLHVAPDVGRTSSSRWRARPSACGRTSTAARPLQDGRRARQARQLREGVARDAASASARAPVVRPHGLTPSRALLTKP